MVDSEVGQWLSMSGAARLLGVSRQAIHHRIKRGTLETRTDNRGNRVVMISSTVVPTVTNRKATGTVDTLPHEETMDEILARIRRIINEDKPTPEPTMAEIMASIRRISTSEPPPSPASVVETVPASVVADLAKAHQQALTAAEARRVADLAALRADHCDTMSLMVERVDAAEVRAERVEQRLDQVLDALLASKRPWWSRIPEPWLRYLVAFSAFVGAGVLVRLLR